MIFFFSILPFQELSFLLNWAYKILRLKRTNMIQKNKRFDNCCLITEFKVIRIFIHDISMHMMEMVENGNMLFASPPPTDEDIHHHRASSSVRSWWDPKWGLKQVVSVGIRTKTSASNLDQLVCPRDLTHQPKLILLIPRPSKPTQLSVSILHL